MKPPIPDPTKSSYEELKFCPVFRVRFWPCLFLTESICLLIMGVFYSVLARYGWPLEMRDYAKVFAFGAIVSLAEAWIYPRLFSVSIHPEKLHGHTFWGFGSIMSWSEITEVRQRFVLGLPYLILSSEKKNKLPIWLPLFLQHYKDFRREINKHTCPQHPLRLWLEERFSQ